MQPSVILFEGASAPNKRLGRMSGAAVEAARSFRTLRRSVVDTGFMAIGGVGVVDGASALV
jgi:hypothetical protein